MGDEPPSGGRRARRRAEPDPASGPPDPVPPFAGGVEAAIAGDPEPRDPRESTAPGPGSPPRSHKKGQGQAKGAAGAAEALAKVDPAKAAKQLIMMSDALITAIFDSRYGEMVDARTGKSIMERFAVTDAEREALTEALALVMRQTLGQVSPIVGFGLMFTATYAGRAAVMEPMLQKARRQRRVQSA